MVTTLTVATSMSGHMGHVSGHWEDHNSLARLTIPAQKSNICSRARVAFFMCAVWGMPAFSISLPGINYTVSWLAPTMPLQRCDQGKRDDVPGLGPVKRSRPVTRPVRDRRRQASFRANIRELPPGPGSGHPGAVRELFSRANDRNARQG